MELSPKVIEKKRLDELENILFACVVSAEITATRCAFLIHNALEKCAEYGGRYAAPVQGTAVKKHFSHCAVT